MRIKRAGIILALGILTALLGATGAAVAASPNAESPNVVTVMPRG
jgi:hypothetical protein